MVKTYNIDAVNLVVGGRVITGLSDGSSISVEKAEDNFEEHVGVKGEVAVAEINNPIAEVTVTLQNTSPSVRYLDGLANKKGENAMVSTQIIDLSTNGINSGGTKSRVVKPSDKEYSNEITEREFTIRIFDYEVDA